VYIKSTYQEFVVLHKKIAIHAIKTGESLNGTVESILDAHFNNSTEQKTEEMWRAFSAAQNSFKGYNQFCIGSKETGSYRKGALVN